MKQNFSSMLRSKGLFASENQNFGVSLIFEEPINLVKTDLLGSNFIGSRSYFMQNSQLSNATVGRFCSIAANVGIAPPEHPMNRVSTHPDTIFPGGWYYEYDKGELFSCRTGVPHPKNMRTRIGHDVWIGRNSIIKEGVEIGTGAVVGAGSFVNKNVAPYSIVVGSPARLLRYRFEPEIVERFLALRWWDYVPPANMKFDYRDPVKFLDELETWKDRGILRAFNPNMWRIDSQQDGGYVVVPWTF